jgi:RNA polymerase-binding transcription factor DksA
MPWFDIPGGKVWAGYHRIYRVVIFDPRDQVGVPSDRVRLFTSYDQKSTLFDKRIARRCITDQGYEFELQRAIEAHRSQRKTTEQEFPRREGRKQRHGRYPSPSKATVQEFPVRGICTDCGAPIPPERLAAAPQAIRCVACQTEWESEAPEFRAHQLAWCDG